MSSSVKIMEGLVKIMERAERIASRSHLVPDPDYAHKMSVEGACSRSLTSPCLHCAYCGHVTSRRVCIATMSDSSCRDGTYLLVIGALPLLPSPCNTMKVCACAVVLLATGDTYLCVTDALSSRTSVRAFDSKPVPQEVVRQARTQSITIAW